MNIFRYTYNTWKFQDKKNTITCPSQYSSKDNKLHCDRGGLCSTMDIRKCEYIPKFYLQMIFILYFCTAFFWTNIRLSVTKRKR